MAPKTKTNKKVAHTVKKKTGGKRNPQKPIKQGKGGKKGPPKRANKKKRPAKQRQSSRWDPFPLYSYEVRDVNKVNKNILLAVTCLLLCISVGIIWLGSYLVEQRRTRKEIVFADSFSDYWLNFSLVLLCNGLISAIISFSGWIGVLRENIVLIRVFYVSLIVILVLKLCGAVFLFVFGELSRPLLESMFAEKAVTDYRISSDVETLMDYLQTKFRCCGIRDDGFKDWSRSVYFNCSDDNPSLERCGVPWSCCRNGTGLENALCGHNVQNLDRNIASRTVNTMGCLLALQKWVNAHAVAVGLLGLLEVIIITVVVLQCTHLVNELQMMRGCYRGPWWMWVGKPRPKPPPPGTPPTPAELPRVVQIGHGPPVRRPAPRPTPARRKKPPPKVVVVDADGATRAQVIGDDVFPTSFKGAAPADKDETELSELAEAALTFLSEASEQSYFTHPESPESKSP